MHIKRLSLASPRSIQDNMITYLSAVAVFLLAWLVKKVVETFTKNGPSRSYPPGPRPRPLIGNILDLPTTRGPEVYVEWGKEYHSKPHYHSFIAYYLRR